MKHIRPRERKTRVPKKLSAILTHLPAWPFRPRPYWYPCTNGRLILWAHFAEGARMDDDERRGSARVSNDNPVDIIPSTSEASGYSNHRQSSSSSSSENLDLPYSDDDDDDGGGGGNTSGNASSSSSGSEDISPPMPKRTVSLDSNATTTSGGGGYYGPASKSPSLATTGQSRKLPVRLRPAPFRTQMVRFVCWTTFCTIMSALPSITLSTLGEGDGDTRFVIDS